MLRKSSLFLVLILGVSCALASAAPAKKAAPLARVNARKEVSIKKEFVYDTKGKRDPLQPLVTPDGRIIDVEPRLEKETQIKLDGIVYDPKGKSYAIINKKVAKIGDQVGSYQVIEIYQNKVVVSRNNERIELEIRKGY